MRAALEIQPKRLRGAREAVVARHPGTARAPAALDQGGLGTLRERVSKAASDERALADLARVLSPREVRSLIRGLQLWDELRSAVTVLLRARAKPGLLPQLWGAWQGTPEIEEVRLLAHDLGKKYGWDGVVGSAFAQRADVWLASERPGETIRKWLEGQGLSYSDLTEIAGLPIRTDTPLVRLVHEALMTHGSTSQLRVEGNERLFEWLEELGPENKLHFGRNYLRRMPIAEWGPRILKLLERSYGLPRKPRVQSFWDSIPEEIQKAFQQHFVRRKLRHLFKDDERYKYWERWTGELVDVEYGTAGETPYGVLDFGAFGVVEFFEYGNAAFFYPPEQLKRVLARHASGASDLKQQLFLHGSSNRLIHSQNWHDRATLMVRRWMRGTRKPTGS